MLAMCIRSTMWGHATPEWTRCCSMFPEHIGVASCRVWNHSRNWKPGSRSSWVISTRRVVMFNETRFFLFLTAAVLLAVAPGPGMLYVLARSLAGGKREGVLSALGTFLGGMVHVFAAALGISIILAKSAAAFATVKYVGAAYLGFLGLRMILDARKEK